MLLGNKNEVLILVIMWKNLVDILVDQRSLRQMAQLFCLYEMSKIDRFIETESKCCLGWRRVSGVCGDRCTALKRTLNLGLLRASRLNCVVCVLKSLKAE